MRFTVFRQRQTQRLFGAGLADRAGDADHLGARARPRRGGEIAQAGEHIRHGQQRCVSRELRAPLRGDHGERGFGGKRCGDKVMAVAMLAVNGEERVARIERAAVDGKPGYRKGQGAVAPLNPFTGKAVPAPPFTGAGAGLTQMGQLAAVLGAQAIDLGDV